MLRYNFIWIIIITNYDLNIEHLPWKSEQTQN